jgi:hypothetical protein
MENPVNIEGTNEHSLTVGLPKGFTYFVTDGEAIKIGSSITPESRIKQLQTGTVRTIKTLAIVPMEAADEYQTHQRFAHLRQRGEWFRPEPDLLAFISSLTGKIVRRPKSTAYKLRKRLNAIRRAEDDPVRREQVKLRLDMDKNNAPAIFIMRQDRLMNRVRVAARSG